MTAVTRRQQIEAMKQAAADRAERIAVLEELLAEIVAAMNAAIAANEPFEELLARHREVTAELRATHSEQHEAAVRDRRAGRVAAREVKVEAYREEIFRAPVHQGRAPLVERQRGASRERRSARSSARSGDSGPDSESSDGPSDEPAVARAGCRSRAPPRASQ